MEKAYLVYKQSLEILPGHEFLENNQLLRRMTPLQKVSVEIFALFKKNADFIYNNVIQKLKTPIYFATKYGEIQTAMQLYSMILNKDFPISPIAFQHSVHNCASGYISILHGLHASHLTFSSGDSSFKNATELAISKIKSGTLSSVCVISADESRQLGEVKASAKICVIANPNHFEGLNSYCLKEL